MAALAGLAAIPVVGGAAFLGLLSAAQRTDLKVQREEAKGRRVLPRPWSIVSDDATTKGHWLTVAGACIFGTTVPASAIWQNRAVVGHDDIVLVIVASIAAFAFLLMALVPHRDSRSAPSVTCSSIWHTVTAGTFLAVGTFHAVRTAVFALESYTTNTMFIVRMVFVGLMAVTMLGQLFGGLYQYFVAAKAFNKHYYPLSGEPDLSELSTEEDWKLRKQMVLLVVLQAVWGFAYSVIIMTCAGEVSQLTGGAGTGGIVFGAALLVTLTAAFVAYKLRPDPATALAADAGQGEGEL
eukprot:m.5799 g.5799  ORF g.5799 m.5799 type:complete len:295 (-) comp5089_c0_seq1:308-1192(-)